MTRANLIAEVSRAVDITHRDAKVFVEAIFDSIVKTLRRGERFEMRGFGSFDTRKRTRRIGRNPKTGVRVVVPAKKILYFKPSKELKGLVNNSTASRPMVS